MPSLRPALLGYLIHAHTTSSRILLRCLVPWMMLLMMHQPQLYQPWRLDRSSSITLLKAQTAYHDTSS